ncbi:MAG TPA: helix-turn-helix domain-containing protein [Actinomycetota bacterium]|nr:helix-turn-helix domain-containing protein [Actinomycetota bacterium]
MEGRSKAEVARELGLSPRWVYELCRRFDGQGEAGLEPRSRRPGAAHSGPPTRSRTRSWPCARS